MLLNSNGKDVTSTHDEIRASMHPKKWEAVRPEVVADLREVLEPNREHLGKMFRIETRARMV